ncbi:MAG: M23 family metallopeptidase [Spirochaetes bacterium]|jgi:murein DD-endopeptidase MepM/ murein hydrolase activator NlpD|nr:M23 family metallopeptidase [Spirochaetota bacterium]
MKKLLIIAVILIFSPGLIATDIVFLDNSDVQEYRGNIGKWILINSKETLTALTKKFAVSTDDIIKINNVTNGKISYDYYFIPYSQEYLNSLQEKGKGRIAIQTSIDQYIWPVTDFEKITSVLGFRNRRFHPGLDIPAMNGQPIIASMEGVVTFSGYAAGYGRAVVLQHRDDFSTKYAHNSVNFVKKGEFVRKGQIIGLVGSTGNSTGNHLHFEIRCRDIPLDPLDFFPKLENIQIVHTLKNWK